MRRFAFAAVVACFAPAPATALSALEFDDVGRMVAPISINGQGPYHLVLDTGANRTVVSAQLARELGLAFDGDIAVHGTTGEARASQVNLAHVLGGEFERRDVSAVVVSGDILAGTDGIIGMDGFHDKRVHFNVKDGVFDIGEGGAAAPSGYVPVQGRVRFGTLLEVPIEVGGVRVRALIDTGSNVSLVNDALIHALRLGNRTTRGFDVSGAGAARETVRVRLEHIKLGALGMDRIDAYRADLPHARDGQVEEAPAMILGMDVWRQVQAMAIDLARAELQVLPERGV
jgi:clan AA aspartic protease (TIGR02281 family)